MPLRILFKDSYEGFSKELFEELLKESSRETAKDFYAAEIFFPNDFSKELPKECSKKFFQELFRECP